MRAKMFLYWVDFPQKRSRVPLFVFQFADLLFMYLEIQSQQKAINQSSELWADYTDYTDYSGSDLVCLLSFQLKFSTRSFVILTHQESGGITWRDLSALNNTIVIGISSGFYTYSAMFSLRCPCVGLTAAKFLFLVWGISPYCLAPNCPDDIGADDPQ